MLHRAATNAYSWWYASHIRTKQSKWLEQNLVDMEEMVQNMLKIIEQEGDSFVKRVEMYYKKRPELIHFVEEAYRAYRALAERYDHLSKDLQDANRTIASAFPDQMQLSMESDDDSHDTSSFGSIPPSPDRSEKSFKRIPSIPKNFPTSPRFPRQPLHFLKGDSVVAAKKEQLRRTGSSLTSSVMPANASGLTKEEAAREIDTLQKDILALQTEKEFLKSSYEAGMAKYWETEGKINDLHTRVYNLQDEFGIETVIEDGKARSLMASTALSSCSEVLNKVQAEQERSAEEVKDQYARIKEADERLQALKKQINPVQGSQQEQPTHEALTEPQLDNTDSLRQKIREKLSADSNAALTEHELAEMIDQLVQKIVVLETTIFSQNGLLKRLKRYIDDLVQHISSLEGNTESIAHTEDNVKRILELEAELSKVRSMNEDLVAQKNSLNVELTETNCNLDHLMEKLEDLNPIEPEKETKDEAEAEAEPEVVLGQEEEEDEGEKQSVESQTGESAISDAEVQDLGVEDKDGMNWRTMYTTNIEERERIFLEEYTVILRDYKPNKIKLSEAEKKNREYIFELTSLARELRNTITTKDDEIKRLLRKVNDLQESRKETNDVESESCNTPREDDHPQIKHQHQLQLQHHERSISAGEPGRQWGYSYDPDRKPLFHHLYDPKHEIMARHTSAAAEGSSRRRDPFGESPGPVVSRVEARLRTELNKVLEGNLDFWMRFTTSFQQIQKFQATIKDLQADLSKLRHSKNLEGVNSYSIQALQSEAKPLYKHLREIQTEMALWHEHSTVFHDELRTRFGSLNNIQEEIVKVLNAGKKSGYPELSEFQAAKFQGEIINMKQENKKVEDELQLGIYKVKELQRETEKALVKLEKEFKLAEYKRSYSGILKSPSIKSKIPLHALLFGMKLKKNKNKNLAITG